VSGALHHRRKIREAEVEPIRIRAELRVDDHIRKQGGAQRAEMMTFAANSITSSASMPKYLPAYLIGRLAALAGSSVSAAAIAL
jgi:hypothetical protein